MSNHNKSYSVITYLLILIIIISYHNKFQSILSKLTKTALCSKLQFASRSRKERKMVKRWFNVSSGSLNGFESRSQFIKDTFAASWDQHSISSLFKTLLRFQHPSVCFQAILAQTVQLCLMSKIWIPNAAKHKFEEVLYQTPYPVKTKLKNKK